MAATAFGVIEEHNEDATVRISNLSTECDEELLHELMCQAGPIKSVRIIMDKVSGESTGTAYAEYKLEEDAAYATRILNMVKLFGKPLRITSAAGGDNGGQLIDIGANVYVGNLDESVDESVLVDAFASFGDVSRRPTIVRDEQGASKGYGFIYFDTFESADRAIEVCYLEILGEKKDVQMNLSKILPCLNTTLCQKIMSAR